MKACTVILFLVAFSSCILEVYSNCIIEECIQNVRKITDDPQVCSLNQDDMLKKKDEASTELRKCVFDTEEKNAACPESIRTDGKITSEAQRIQDKFGGCGLREARATCQSVEIFLCIGGLGGFAFITNIFALTDLTAMCTQIKSHLNTVDICKSCVGNLFGDAFTPVQADVERIWGIATSLLGGACDCAAGLFEEINKVDTTSDCKFVQSVSKVTEQAAETCLANLVESVQTFDWLTIAKQYLKTIIVFTNNACFWIVGGGASTIALGISTITMVLIAHLVVIYHRFF